MTSYTEVVRSSRPFSIQRFATRLAKFLGAERLRTGSWTEYNGDENSIATMSPWPLTSTMCEVCF